MFQIVLLPKSCDCLCFQHFIYHRKVRSQPLETKAELSFPFFSISDWNTRTGNLIHALPRVLPAGCDHGLRTPTLFVLLWVLFLFSGANRKQTHFQPGQTSACKAAARVASGIPATAKNGTRRSSPWLAARRNRRIDGSRWGRSQPSGWKPSSEESTVLPPLKRKKKKSVHGSCLRLQLFCIVFSGFRLSDFSSFCVNWRRGRIGEKN